MLVSYAAYLIRCWCEGAEVKRVEVVHIQTGERVLLHSTEAALSWIQDQSPVVQSHPPKGGVAYPIGITKQALDIDD
ncbi:MAG: hypothetical protein ACRDFX_03425 [Chloroflexota bacterium]